jgi:hypothetical protein
MASSERDRLARRKTLDTRRPPEAELAQQCASTLTVVVESNGVELLDASN